METTSWSDSFGIGIPELDTEHQTLFVTMADLGVAVTTHDRPNTQRLLRLIAEYAVDHFTHEERLMRRAGYSGYHWHRQQHLTARQRISSLIQAARCGNSSECGLLLEYLNSWLPEHITFHDRMMSASIRNYRRMYRHMRTTARRMRG
ncbi:MAG TPA: hemerythrin family protein [Bryobacteraceae bacterium]|nr:hemerythrin family protein [Bryobacteraceae bacterium]